MAGCPLEVRSAAAQVDADGRVTAWLSTQVPHRDHFGLTATLGMEPGQLRVIAPDVGGGFGAKSAFGAEETLIVWLARHLGKPVRWTETRSESMIALPHGRGQRLELKLGGTRDGKLLAYRIDILADTGAYPGVGAFLPNLTGLLSSGVYAIPRIEVEGLSVVTNTTPMTTIRGAGRPEAAQAIERMVDLFASEIDMDPAELRRKNFIAKDAFPYQTASGATYDSGDYEGALDLALRSVGYEELRAEQQRLRDEGGTVELGIGISSYTEITNPLGEEEYGEVEITADGGAIVHTGSFSHGQGHETTFAMIAGERLGLPIEKITVVKGDTDDVPRGTGTFGSKSTQIGGMAARGAADEVVERAKGLVGDYLEASAADVVLDTALGRFHVVGTPQPALSWAELAERAAADGRLDELKAQHDFKAPPTFPFGVHIAVVEVDVETGKVELRAPRRRRRRGDARQSADRRGPGARRCLHRRRAGPLRGVRLRRRGKPAHGHARRLCVPVVRGPSRLGGDRDGDADARQRARCQGHRRVRDGRRHTGRLERRARRALSLRRPTRRHAVQRRERVACAAGGEGMTSVALTVNGAPHEVDVEPRQLLVYFLRETLGLKGTNVGCDTSSCGACTVLVDGESVKSCTLLAAQADGSEVTTIEGLASADERAASRPAGLPRAARAAMRLLHAGLRHGHRVAAAGEPEPLGATRSGKRSKGTSAAARGTTTSSARSRRRRGRAHDPRSVLVRARRVGRGGDRAPLP